MALAYAPDTIHPTQLALIVAGERIFADRGLHGVSLREIGAAAGQRNNNVTQYHFGSKEGLVVAIFKYRSAVVNANRLRRLEAASRLGPPNARSLIEAFLVPLGEQIADGNSYVQFLARLRTDGNNSILYDCREPEMVSAFYQIAEALRSGELVHLTQERFRCRLRLIVDLGISALAKWDDGMLALDEYMYELVDGLTAMALATGHRASNAASTS